MELFINGKNTEITDGIKLHVDKKLQRLERHSSKVDKLTINLEVVNNHTFKANANMHIPGHSYHADSKSDDMYDAIDVLVDKLVKIIDEYNSEK